ncbi:MAG TPA: CBS domain-containing protein [Anaerolineaceae bacterium]|nr:CBS domain-containing protein [Anaerolineaceae bacterium]
MPDEKPSQAPVSRANRLITDKDASEITRAEELAYELRVEDVMTKNASRLEPTQTMRTALELFRQKHISGAPVVEGELLLGIVSMEDLIRCMMQNGLEDPIAKYMSTRLVTAKASDPVIEALKAFVAYNVGRLPIVDTEGRLKGILTKGDVSRGLLNALQIDYHAEEVRRYRASHLFEDIESDRTSLILRYNILPRDFNRGGAASSNIKRALLRLGSDPRIARRASIAIYEAEMNLIIHTTNGGVLRVEIEPHQISIDAYDDGPGIPDVNQAMKPGYSTAGEKIRELGFGAGMGLVNINRCVDDMKLESVVGKGTRLRLKIFLQAPQPPPAQAVDPHKGRTLEQK